MGNFLMKLLGVLLILGGFALGIYLGVYVMLYGGICQIIDSLNPLVTKDLAFGVIRTIFFEIGFVPTYVFVTLGMMFIAE